ncbi:hypothetical protein [Defluviitalea phaphyphila]|nr:hypothetical protein [Defluviitalea phaphyphila]
MKKRVLGLIFFACGMGMIFTLFIPGAIFLFIIAIICIILGCFFIGKY